MTLVRKVSRGLGVTLLIIGFLYLSADFAFWTWKVIRESFWQFLNPFSYFRTIFRMMSYPDAWVALGLTGVALGLNNFGEKKTT